MRTARRLGLPSILFVGASFLAAACHVGGGGSGADAGPHGADAGGPGDDGGTPNPWPAPRELGPTGLGDPILVPLSSRGMMLVSPLLDQNGLGVEARRFDHAAGSWMSPTRLDDGHIGSTGTSTASGAVADGTGTDVFVAYAEELADSGFVDTVLVRHYEQGSGWSAATTLDSPAPSDATPAMTHLSLSVHPEGTALLGWLHGTNNTGPRHAQAAVYDPAGGWTPVAVGIDGDAVSAVAAPGGGGVVFVDGVVGQGTALRAVPIAQDGTVGAPVTLDPATGGTTNAEAVVGSDGATTVVWNHLSASAQLTLLYARLPASQTAWSAATPVVPPDPSKDPSGGPGRRLVARAGAVTVAWHVVSNGGDALAVATAPDGQPFGAPTVLVPPNAEAVGGFMSYAEGPSGRAVVAAPGEYDVLVAVRPAGDSFGPVLPVGDFSTPDDVAGVASAVDDAGDIFLAWSESSDTPGTLYWDELPAP